MLRWRTMSRLSQALWFVVVLGLLVYLGLALWIAWNGIFFPFQLDYGEGDALLFTHQLALGQPIYLGLETGTYATSNYPPLAFLLAVPGRALFGDNFIFGRWLDFAAAILVAAFIFRFVQAEAKSRFAALLATLFFLGSTFVYHWIPLFRVDLIGLAFTVAGIFCVWRWEKSASGARSSGRRTNGYLVFAVLFFLAALYSKHSLLFAPAAAALAIFLKDRRAGVLFALGLGISGGAIFLALNQLTNGGWSFGILTANATVWRPEIFGGLMLSFFLTYGVLIVIAAWVWIARVRSRQWGVLEVYAPAALLSLALAGREGAWENYFLEAITVVCVFAGFGMAAWRQHQGAIQWALPLVLLLQLALFCNDHDPRIAMRLFDEVRAGNAHAAPLVRAAQGPLVSEDMGLLIMNGKPVDYYSFPYSTLARAGLWDQHWEIENLRAGKFPLVILFQGTREDVDNLRNFTHAFASALDYGYDRTSEDAHYAIYTPAPLEHLEPRANFDDKIGLVGWTLAPNSPNIAPGLQAGDTLHLTTVWQALALLNARYKTFAHIEDAQGNVVAQDDHEPRQGSYPTMRWADGEMVRDAYELRLPSNLAPGNYFLRVGWYDELTQDRLGVKGGADSVELTQWNTH